MNDKRPEEVKKLVLDLTDKWVIKDYTWGDIDKIDADIEKTILNFASKERKKVIEECARIADKLCNDGEISCNCAETIRSLKGTQ